jgi:hypothetical protein
MNLRYIFITAATALIATNISGVCFQNMTFLSDMDLIDRAVEQEISSSERLRNLGIETTGLFYQKYGGSTRCCRVDRWSTFMSSHLENAIRRVLGPCRFLVSLNYEIYLVNYVVDTCGTKVKRHQLNAG